MSQQGRKRVAILIIEVLLIVLLPLMGSRSTLLIVLLYIIIRFVVPRARLTRSSIVRTILSIVGCIFILSVAITIMSSSMLESFQVLYDIGSMTFSRFQVYKESIALFFEHPIFGRGPFSYHVYDAVFTHNFILETLVEQGVVGSIPYIAALIIILRQLKRRGRFGYTYFYAVVFSLIKGLVEPAFFLPNFEVFFWLFVGLGCRRMRCDIAGNNCLRTRQYVEA